MKSIGQGAPPRLLELLAQIDAAWLTTVLQRAGYGRARVTQFLATAIGNGNVSDTVRVDLSYADEALGPSSLVCKFRSVDNASHAHGVSSGSYFREVESYRLIGQACRTPQLYWVDGSHDNINLVMEDLTGVSRPGDQIAGCGPGDARAVIVELARLHRCFYPMAAEEAPAWAMSMAATAGYWAAAVDRALPVIREHVADRLSESEMITTQAACAVARCWYERPVLRASLTHGDPRVDNILFLDGAGEGEVQAVLIDWQLTGWRNPMHDVGYFLSGSVSIEDRRAHERELLEVYSQAFGSSYPLEAITEDYRIQLLSGAMTTIASYGLLPLNAKYDALLLTLLRRNLAAAADWDSIEAVQALQATG